LLLVDGARDFDAGHGSLAGVAVLTGHENPQHIWARDGMPGMLRWEANAEA